MTDYPKPSLTADVVAFAIDEALDVRVLFIKRKNEPWKGQWALPGGFCEPNETIERCAARELEEETKLANVDVEQLAMFSKPGRDPRGWLVTMAHLAYVARASMASARAGDDAADVGWLRVRTRRDGYDVLDHEAKVVKLAADHHEILGAALKRARGDERSRVLPESLRARLVELEGAAP